MSLTQASAHRKDLNAGKGPVEHRHFAAIATIIRENRLPDDVMHVFAQALVETNPRFDMARFMAACRHD
jgi:hypothetical protein